MGTTRILWLGSFLLLMSVGTAAAQTSNDTPRFELGGQIGGLNLKEFSLVLPRRIETAIGARITINLNRMLAVETQVDAYPGDEFFIDRDKVQAVAGIKAGLRGSRVGLFGKFRPGIIHTKEPLQCFIPEGCGPLPIPFDQRALGYSIRNWLAVDAGAVAEIYLSRRLVARVDIGDMLVRRWDHHDATGRSHYFVSHNLQMGVGAAVRFP
jgi:hypothetical protein